MIFSSPPTGLLGHCRNQAERAAAERIITLMDRGISEASAAGVDIDLFYMLLFERIYGALRARHGASEVLSGIEIFIRTQRGHAARGAAIAEPPATPPEPSSTVH
jgi:hypothetical protein